MLLPLATCRVDLVRGLVFRPGGELALTTRESELLAYLAERPFESISREELLASVWGYSDAVVSRACDNTIRRLREKIEDDPQNPRHVLTVHGMGYRFVPEGASEKPQAGQRPEGATPMPAPTQAGPVPLVSFLAGAQRVDLSRGLIEGPQGRVPLTAREIALLQCLYQARGAVVERRALLRALGVEGGGRAVDNLVVRLRKKLESDPARPRFLLTASGGYRLEPSHEPPVQLAPPSGRPLPAEAAPPGRAELLEELRRELQSSPFVLLQGPMGVGKTLLASLWARESEAIWVDLRDAEAGQVAERVARALELPLGDLQPADRVAAALSGRTVRVVLDNLDAVADSILPLIERWVRAGPDSRWLGTSRVQVGGALGAAWPHLEVPPLPEEDAIDLFLSRVSRIRRSSREPLDRAQVRALVQQLDGLPLAIELAAARCSALGLQALADRLSLDLLSDPRGQGLHASLRRTVASAIAPLPEEESQALHVLALPRSFDIDDAEAMLGPSAIDLVQALRDRSLLREDPAWLGKGALRLSCWQSVRLFLEEEREALPDGGKAIVLRYARAMVERAREGEQGVPSRERRERMQRVLDDMARAVELGRRYDLPEVALCAISAGWWYTWNGPAQPGVAILQRALGLQGLTPEHHRMIEHILGRLLVERGEHHAARQAQERAVAMADAAGDQWLASRGRGALALVLKILGEFDRASVLLREAAEIALAMGDPAYAGTLRGQAALAAGEYEAAIEAFEACRRTAGDARDLVTFGHYGLGMAWLRLGRLSVSAEHLRTALARWEDADRSAWITVSAHLAHVLAQLGELPALEAFVATALPAAQCDGCSYEEAQHSIHLAVGRMFSGAPESARELLARARTLHEHAPACPPATLAYLEVRAADLALLTGAPALALEHALRAEQLAPPTRSSSTPLLASHIAAMASLELGTPDLAGQRLEQALPAIPSLPSRADRAVQRARWAVVAQRLGRLEEARAWREEARAEMGWTGAKEGSELGWWLKEPSPPPFLQGQGTAAS